MSAFSELRTLTAGDHEAFVECIGSGFGYRMDERSRARLLAFVEPERTLVAVERNQVVGTATSFALEITLPGCVVVPAAGVSEVTVLPTHRRRGVLSAMMRRQLDDLRDSGEMLAMLLASEGAIYGRFGYGPAIFSCRYEIDKTRARLVAAVKDDAGSVRLLTTAQAAEAFPEVLDAHRKVAPGEVGRPAAHWDEFFDAPDWMESNPRRRFFAVHETGAGADGYVSYEVSPHPTDPRSRLVDLHELVALSDGVYASLWSFVLGVDLTTAVRTRRRPLDEPLRFMLDDPRQLRTVSVNDTIWVRFVDARRALTARRWTREGRLVLEVIDDFCPWVGGRYVIDAADDGSAEVDGPLATDAAGGSGAAALRADLTLESSSLATAYFGGVSLATLARAGRAVENVAGSALRADEMLACRPPAFCTTGF